MKACTIADKTCLEAGLVGAATSVTDDWDSGTPVQVKGGGTLHCDLWGQEPPFFASTPVLQVNLYHSIRSSFLRTEVPASALPHCPVFFPDGQSQVVTQEGLPPHFSVRMPVVERRGKC